MSSVQSLPKTKLLLIQTLNEMLKEVTIEDITIMALVNRSTITRSTFYTHYHDKYALFEDLVFYLYKDILDSLNLDVIASNNEALLQQLKDNYRLTLKKLYDNRHVFNQIPAKSRLKAIREGIGFSKHNFTAQLESVDIDSSLNIEYATHFFLSGLFMTYDFWMTNNYDLSIDELSNQLTYLTAFQFNLKD